MKDGLRNKLNNWIEGEQGRLVTISAIEAQVRQWGYKISNYERRLRPSESPGIEAVKNDKGVIIGYRKKRSSDWCVHCGWFMTHAKGCDSLVQEPQELVLF